MKLQIIVRLFLCLVLFWQTIAAFETDQFNLSPQPLADIGDEVSIYVQENIEKAFEKINAEIIAAQNCLENKTVKGKNEKCDSAEKERAKLEFLRSNDAVAKEVYGLLGSGFIPFTKSGSWMESHRFNAQPARFKTSYPKSIFVNIPTDYFTISSTVNLYEAEFGTDKIAHFFQQGYDYYKIYRRGLAEKLSTEKATEKAVRWGQKTERTFYGTLVSGVYSNADLYANFVGLKFYLNLTDSIRIGSETKPAVLRLENGIWTIDKNADLPENLIKPFVSKHLNEALNPSVYSNLFRLRFSVRKVVRKRSCRQWTDRFPNLSKANFDDITQSLKLWHGEDYGFTDSRNFITIGSTCFGS